MSKSLCHAGPGRGLDSTTPFSQIPSSLPRGADTFATTGWKGLDEVLGGIAPGDNVVWSVESIDDYRVLVVPYERAAAESGLRRIYFRFGTHAPLLPETNGLEVHHMDPSAGFEPFVRAIHRVIESVGPDAA